MSITPARRRAILFMSHLSFFEPSPILFLHSLGLTSSNHWAPSQARFPVRFPHHAASGSYRVTSGTGVPGLRQPRLYPASLPLGCNSILPVWCICCSIAILCQQYIFSFHSHSVGLVATS